MNRFENRLNKDIKKFHALNPVWDNHSVDALNVFEMIDELNALYEENISLKNENLQLVNSSLKNKNYTSFINEIKELKKDLIEQKRILGLSEEQVIELRRLVHIVTNNDFIKEDKKEEWRKELGW